MKILIGVTAGLIAALVAFVAWAEFPDECESLERESDHRLALCKWNRGEFNVDSMDFQAYTDYPNCRIRLRFYLADGALPPVDGLWVGVKLHTGDDSWDAGADSYGWYNAYIHAKERSGRLPLKEGYGILGDGYIDTPLEFHVSYKTDAIHMSIAAIPDVYPSDSVVDTYRAGRVFKRARLDITVPSRGQQGGEYVLSAEVDVADSLNNRKAVIGACLDRLQQIHQDKLHAEAEAAREVEEKETARLAEEAARLEEEQAIREAQTQARIDEVKLAAANESKKRVIEAERIKTETLITKIETERAVADILFEVTRIRLRGTEERAALTNEWLEERVRETEEFSKEIVEIEESIQRYNKFNRAFLDSIQRYQADIDARVAKAEQQLQALIDEAIALNEVEDAENKDE